MNTIKPLHFCFCFLALVGCGAKNKFQVLSSRLIAITAPLTLKKSFTENDLKRWSH
jgi:hypothetical protein